MPHMSINPGHMAAADDAGAAEARRKAAADDAGAAEAGRKAAADEAGAAEAISARAGAAEAGQRRRGIGYPTQLATKRGIK